MKHAGRILMLLAFAVACSKADTDTASSGETGATATATAGGSGDGCLPGTWTQSSPSFSPKFVFNADGTGAETVAESQGGETRNFTWKMKGTDQVTITFPASGDVVESSTDWNVDCQNMKFASLYTKQ
jgi:hypothetical protein